MTYYGGKELADSFRRVRVSPKEHEMHHRGQLVVLERTLGLVPHLTRQFQDRMAQAQR